jgi:catechol 2,3-dioxygenase-like lactoylglutathione lyase family enzyme
VVGLVDRAAPSEDRAAMESRLNFVTLVVSDLDRARRFYLDGLGWTAALDVDGEVVMIHVGDKLVLSLWAEASARSEIGEVRRGGTLPFTLAHNVASPAQVDAVLATARAAGATVFDARTRDWGGYTGYFVDPDGFRWEIAFNPHPIGGMHLP